MAVSGQALTSAELAEAKPSYTHVVVDGLAVAVVVFRTKKRKQSTVGRCAGNWTDAAVLNENFIELLTPIKYASLGRKHKLCYTTAVQSPENTNCFCGPNTK
jgi:hypothetical protein